MDLLNHRGTKAQRLGFPFRTLIISLCLRGENRGQKLLGGRRPLPQSKIKGDQSESKQIKAKRSKPNLATERRRPKIKAKQSKSKLNKAKSEKTGA
jgi:hypothetical protein